jgi:hypothetical protein
VILPYQNTYKEIDSFPVGNEPHHLVAVLDGKSLIIAYVVRDQPLFLNPKASQIRRQVKNIVDSSQNGFFPDIYRRLFAG